MPVEVADLQASASIAKGGEADQAAPSPQGHPVPLRDELGPDRPALRLGEMAEHVTRQREGAQPVAHCQDLEGPQSDDIVHDRVEGEHELEAEVCLALGATGRGVDTTTPGLTDPRDGEPLDGPDACAVPMGLENDELAAVVDAERVSGKRYMMMETSVYGREYRYVARLLQEGRLGTLTAYRGFHIQNLDGYPAYWQGYPPMKYLTHALSPLLALTGATVRDVVCYGSSRLTTDRLGPFGNPFPVEVGLFRLSGSDVIGEITMSFFQTARTYTEGFAVYGDAMSIEWPNEVDGPLTVHELLPLDPDQPDAGLRGRRSQTSRVEPADETDELPEQLRRFVRPYVLEAAAGGPAITKLAEHGGSHPFLVHEFISALVEDRPAAIDAPTAAAWTAPGIVAHASALAHGERVPVPAYR